MPAFYSQTAPLTHWNEARGHVKMAMDMRVFSPARLIACCCALALPGILPAAAPFQPGEVFRDCAVCPEMVVLPAGGLALGRYEVTVGEYGAFAAATGGRARAGCIAQGRGDSWQNPGYPQTDRHPVTCVSWDDAQEYVAWLSRETGAGYRLPSEVEWAQAAVGSRLGCHHSRTDDQAACPVGSYGANAAGLSDMVGNQWEWTADCWEGDCTRRTLRGASWHNGAEFQLPGTRNGDLPGRRIGHIGFRVARSLE